MYPLSCLDVLSKFLKYTVYGRWLYGMLLPKVVSWAGKYGRYFANVWKIDLSYMLIPDKYMPVWLNYSNSK